MASVSVSPAVGRDAGSVWVLRPRPLQIGRLRIVPENADADRAALRLIDAAAFGTGLHPTTALCLEAIDHALQHAVPDSMLDVGTGSGVLALGALTLGVPRATGLDIDGDSLRIAAANARLNELDTRLDLRGGTPDDVAGAWPLVVANVLAAPLVEMAPAMVRRVRHHGELVLSGFPSALEPDVARAYCRLGMQRVRTTSRADWAALVLRATW
jgi:ribosomal protein L11 methyltransferase